jgi:beta-aspartyl-peptidase (threonine type)
MEQNNAAYAAMIDSLDQSAGRIRETLKNLEIADRTVVIFTSDNGGRVPTTSNLPLRVGKGSCYEGGTRVPLIIDWPGVTQPGSVCETPVISMDLYPTIAEIAGASGAVKHAADGLDLGPLLRQSGKLARDELFWHYPHYQHYQLGGATPYSAIRKGDYKLIEYLDDQRVELYNLDDDIGEQHNLAAKMPEKVQALRERLNTWRQEVGAQMPSRNPNYDASKPEHTAPSKKNHQQRRAAAKSQPTDVKPASIRWAIALHTGAGSWARDLKPEDREPLEQSLRTALTLGKDVLAQGGTALDAVEKVVVALEDDPRFNAGKGAVFTRAGTHELDASIMDGKTLRCGAVGGVNSQKNPVKVARLVMERTPHILLSGDEADAFGAKNGCEQVTQDYFYTEKRFRQLQEALKKEGLNPLTKPAYPMKDSAASAVEPTSDGLRGTVGCVALDSHGNVAAATSTGGLSGKMPGRLGDTPIIGAGNYADNKSCAVSGTGKGEEFIRHSIAVRVGLLMQERKVALAEAVRICVHEVLRPGDGGVIAVDRKGHVSMQSNTGAMPRAMADSTGRFETAIWFDR